MKTTTGYQWGDAGDFIGEYEIPTIQGKDPQLPPRTILVAPPTNIPEGKYIAINSSENAWELKDE